MFISSLNFNEKCFAIKKIINSLKKYCDGVDEGYTQVWQFK